MKESGTLIAVWVKPGSRKPGISLERGQLTIRVREPARDGEANEACRRALAKHLGIPQSAVRLVRGATSRQKLFAIDAPAR